MDKDNKNKVGRPTDMTEETVRKIEEVAALDGTVEEMAFFANVHRATIYRWMEKYPEFSNRIEQLKQTPFLKARRTIVESLGEPENAFKYMSKKKKDEFSDRSEITGANGESLTVNVINYGDTNTTQLPTKEISKESIESDRQ